MHFLGQPPPGASPDIPSWDEFRFSPVGLYYLRSRLMGSLEPSVFQRFLPNFEAAEAAWFAAGLASSPSDIPADEFYPELHEVRRNTPKTGGTDIRKALRQRLRSLTFDCAALLDRAFGSTTLVIHIPGTTRPRSLLREDYIKAETYFPAHLLREDERIPRAIFDIVQKYIRDVGIPTIARYQFCASRYWPLSQDCLMPPPFPRQSIRPPAKPVNSSNFEYNGQVIKPPIVILDEDDNREKERLKEELKNVRKLLEEANRALAESQRREEDLLSQIVRLTSLASETQPVAPTARRFAGPGSALSQPPVSSGSTAARSPSRRNHATGSTPSSTMDGASNRSGMQAGTDTGSQYRNFIRSNLLDSKYPQIERIRTNVPVYLWRVDLQELGISQNIVDNLIPLMGRRSRDS